MPASPNPVHVKNESECGRGFLAWQIWIVYALLAIAGVPWYWPPDFEGTLFGLPTWTLCSLAASLVASCFTAWLLIKKWPTDDAPTEEPIQQESRS